MAVELFSATLLTHGGGFVQIEVRYGYSVGYCRHGLSTWPVTDWFDPSVDTQYRVELQGF